VVEDDNSPVTVNSSRKVKRSTTAPSKSSTVSAVKPSTKPSTKKTKRKKKEPKKKLKDDGNIERLREERRDLFDLLYGDDPGILDDDKEDDDDIVTSTSATVVATTLRTKSGVGKLNGLNGANGVNNLMGRKKARQKSLSNFDSLLGDRTDLDDEDLDDFDPYGLEDF